MPGDLAALQEDVARLYGERVGVESTAAPVEAPFDFDTGITVSNGGLNAPLGDMAKYLGFLIGDERKRAVYDGVLSRASLEEMFTRQIEAKDGEGGSGSDVWAGLSCFVERHQGQELVGHSGDQNGFISHLYFHRPSRSGIRPLPADGTACPQTAVGAVDRLRFRRDASDPCELRD